MRKLSDEWITQVSTGFWDTARCSVCGKESRYEYRNVFRMVHKDGIPYASGFLGADPMVVRQDTSLPDDIYFQCKNCGSMWPVFKDLTTNNIIEVIDTHRSATTMGEDRYEQNNPSPATATRRLNLEQSWSQTWNVEYEKIDRNAIATSLDVKGLGGLKSEIETYMKEKYTTSETLSRTYTDELTLALPPNTSVTVTIEWKKVWQHGLIKLSNGEEIPFKVAVGVTYDFDQAPNV